MIRAKFKCISVERREGASEKVSLIPVYGKDGTTNAQWSKGTPDGSCWITFNGPELTGKFVPGQEYFVDFSEAQSDK